MLARYPTGLVFCNIDLFWVIKVNLSHQDPFWLMLSKYKDHKGSYWFILSHPNKVGNIGYFWLTLVDFGWSLFILVDMGSSWLILVILDLGCSWLILFCLIDLGWVGWSWLILIDLGWFWFIWVFWLILVDLCSSWLTFSVILIILGLYWLILVPSVWYG